MATTEQLERGQKAALDAKRNRKYREEFRKGIFEDRQNTEPDEDIPQESAHKRNLNLLKASAVRNSTKNSFSKEIGGKVGASVGGLLLPGIGIFLGSFIGKKLGIAGFIIIAILAVFFQVVLFIVVLKSYCDGLGYLGKAADYVTLGVCQSFK